MDTLVLSLTIWIYSGNGMHAVITIIINIRETEGAIKNEQSRETGNIGYTGQRQTKRKMQCNMCWTPPNTKRIQTKQKVDFL
jgi:hypothetical protein